MMPMLRGSGAHAFGLSRTRSVEGGRARPRRCSAPTIVYQSRLRANWVRFRVERPGAHRACSVGRIPDRQLGLDQPSQIQPEAPPGLRVVRLGNFQLLLASDEFWSALWITLKFTALVVALVITLGLLIALFLRTAAFPGNPSSVRFDGIVLHQILQWHHMLTSAGYPPYSVENLKVNTFWDGLSRPHILFTGLGLFILGRYSRKSHIRWSGKLLSVRCSSASESKLNLWEQAHEASSLKRASRISVSRR